LQMVYSASDDDDDDVASRRASAAVMDGFSLLCGDAAQLATAWCLARAAATNDTGTGLARPRGTLDVEALQRLVEAAGAIADADASTTPEKRKKLTKV
jgi:hypothetical protein